MAQKFTITAELNLKAKNIGQVVKQLQSQFQGANVNFNIQQMAAAQAQLKKVGTSAQSASKSVNGLAKNISDAAKRFSALTIATGTFVGLARAIKNAVGDAIEFQREVVKIAQATGQSTASLKGLEQEITRVSSTLGVSSKELLVAARNLTQAGFAANKVKGALDLLAKTELAATFDSIADTTEGVIAILNQFGRAAQKNGTEIEFLEKSLSAINQVSKDFAVESSDLITAIRTTGSAFESAGGSLDELLGLFTSVRATTRESAESIATGFRTIFTRTQRVDTINNLKKLGIELQDASGKFVGPIEATRRLSAALSTIDPRDFRFNVIVEELGGFRQVSKVIPLIQQFGVATKALSVAQKSSGSLAKDAVTAQEALSVQIAKVREEFLAFIRDLTGSNTFQSTIKGLLDLSSAFIKVAESVKPLLPLIGTFGAAKLGLNFLPSINQSLARRKASGGVIHGFASGGLVPGQGNGDTVPAMLSPGEFVIRKSSVKKLGVNNLSKINKYNGGGKVIGDLGGIASNTEILFNNENLGLKNDRFKISVSREKVKINESEYNNLEKGGRGWENYLAKKLNAKVYPSLSGEKNTESDFRYPIDMETDKAFIDAKDFTSVSSIPIVEGYKKALSHLLYQKYRSKYKFQGANSNKINAGDDNFYNTKLSKESDTIYSPKKMQLLFPDIVKGKAAGGIIQKFALGGPAGKSRAARAITIPRANDYTFDKPAGVDLDQLNANKQQYKLNAEDQIDYTPDKRNIDVSTLSNIPNDLLDTYYKADAQKRGYAFEKILEQAGLASSLSAISNARLDGVTASGDPFEAKSRLTAITEGELADKLYGAVAESRVEAEKLVRQRFNQHKLTAGHDIIDLGKVTVFEDVTGGLGAAVNSKGRMGYAEEEAARQAREQGKQTSITAQQRLREIVDKNFASGFKIINTQYSPIGDKGVHRDVAGLLNKKLGGPYQEKFASMTDEQILQILKQFIVKKAMGGGVGTDTVPALLTPGEFVINRKSAQSIGYSALNRMNQVGKFANGGIVPQRMLFGGIKTAGQAAIATSSAVQAQGINISNKGVSILDKIFTKLEQDGGNLSAAFKVLEKEIKNTKSGGRLKIGKDLQEELKGAGKQPVKDVSNKLLLLSTAAGSVATQFTTLSSETQSGITSLITSFGILKTVIDSAADTGEEVFGKRFASFGKSIKMGSIAIAGIQAVAQGYIAYSEESVKKSGEKINKELDKALQGQGNRAEVEAQSRAIGQEYSANSATSYARNASSKAGMIGGLTGGVLGSFLGPVGAAVGAAAGTAIGGSIDRYLNPPMKDAEKYFTEMGLAIFDTNKELFRLGKAAEKFGEMSFGRVQAESVKAAKSLSDLQDRLEVQKSASQKDPQNESIKAQISQTEEQIKKYNEIIGRGVGELNVKTARNIAAATRVGGDVDAKSITKQLMQPVTIAAQSAIDALKKKITDKTKEKNQAKTEESRTKIAQELVILEESLATAQSSLVDSTLEQEQQVYKVIAQTARQEAALKAEQEARDSLIGSIVQEKAVRDSISRFQLKVDSLNSSFTALQSVFEEGVDLKGFNNFENISKSLSVEKPTKEFEQGLSILSSAFGQDGVKLGNNLRSLQNASGGLDTALVELNKGLEANINYEQFFATYFKQQGIDVSEAVIKQIGNVTRTTIGGEDKEKGVVPGSATAEARKQIISLFEDIKKTSVDQAQTIISSFSTYENELNQRLSKFAQIVQTLNNYQLETVDRFKKFNDIMGQATGRRVTFQEKEFYRQQKQSMLGGGNAKDLGNKLLALQSKQVQMTMQRQGKPLTNRNEIEQYNRSVIDLKLQTDQTVKALQSLADQSEKTGDILNEIERIRGQREAVQGLSRQFAFGSDEERKSIATSIQALNIALTAGNLDAIPEELRSSVGQLLDQFKDVPIFGGLTGENISKQFQFKELIKSGVAPQFAQSIFNQSTPEQQLISELQRTFAQEEEARKALANREFQQQDLLIANIAQLNKNFDIMISDILGARALAQGQTTAARGALAQQGIRAASDQSSIDLLARARQADARERAIQAQRDKNAAQKRAKGGLIYRAGGGSIFQPQGTDTVPAMLTPGEYVIRKDAVDAIGVDTLNQINGYAGGGIVGFRGQQLAQQMASRNNMFYNQMMAGPNIADQFGVMSSYYNMTRLSPKQRREMYGGGSRQQTEDMQAESARLQKEELYNRRVQAYKEYQKRYPKEAEPKPLTREQALQLQQQYVSRYIPVTGNNASPGAGGRLMNAVGPTPNANKKSQVNNTSQLAAQYIKNAAGPIDVEAEKRRVYEQSYGRRIAGLGGYLSGIPVFGNIASGLSSAATGAADLYMGTQTFRGVAQDTIGSFIIGKVLGRAGGKALKYSPKSKNPVSQAKAAMTGRIDLTKDYYESISGKGSISYKGSAPARGDFSGLSQRYGTTVNLGQQRGRAGITNLLNQQRSSYPVLSQGSSLGNVPIQSKNILRPDKYSTGTGYGIIDSRSGGYSAPVYRSSGGLIGGTRLKRFAEGGPVDENIASMGGGPNIEALMGVANTFAAFTESMSKISETLNGLTMQHQVTIDGQLNLNGINSAEIAEVIKNQVGTFIANEVSRVMQSERMKP